MKKEYVSKTITINEISKWHNGDNIKILSGTGSGKTYWAINTLAPYCKSKNKKILFLVHRRSLYEQVLQDINSANVSDTVTVETYQSIITKYKHNVLSLLDYDMIIYDEYQFLINDAGFIADTEIIYNLIKLKSKHIKIFISANNINLGLNFSKEYIIGDISKDISNRINTAYMLPDRQQFKSLINEILDNTDDKIFCYINNNYIMKDLIEEFKNEIALYVSEDNPLYKYSDENDIINLALNNKVDKRIILANSSMDAGVSIIDKKIKHIIAEERNIEKLYQVIGRKRIIGDEKFNLYISHLHSKMIAGYKTQILRQISLINEYYEDEKLFCKKYGRSSLDNTIFYTDPNGILKVNKMAKYYLGYILEQYNKYLSLGYTEVLEEEFNIKFIDIEFQEKKESLIVYLNSIIGKRLISKEDKNKLINKIDYRFNGRQYRTPKKLNEGLMSENINYVILTKKSNSIRYWTVEKLQE